MVEWSRSNEVIFPRETTPINVDFVLGPHLRTAVLLTDVKWVFVSADYNVYVHVSIDGDGCGVWFSALDFVRHADRTTWHVVRRASTKIVQVKMKKGVMVCYRQT